MTITNFLVLALIIAGCLSQYILRLPAIGRIGPYPLGTNQPNQQAVSGNVQFTLIEVSYITKPAPQIDVFLRDYATGNLTLPDGSKDMQVNGILTTFILINANTSNLVRN
jgi:hypothetical protein